MQFQILQTDLNRGLSIVSRASASRGQLPVLANVLIEAGKDGIKLCSTNLEISLRVNIGGKTTEEGATTIPARNLTEYVSALPSGMLTITTDGEKLKITGEKSSAVFSGIPASEFPIIPTSSVEYKNLLSLSIKDFTAIAKQVVFAAATDESRPVLTGVQFKTEEETLVITATDGFRMSQKRIQNSKFKIQNSLILPAKTILEVAKLSEGTKKDEINIQFIEQNNQVIFQLGEIELVSRILEGNFPDIAKIMPSEIITEAVIDREEWQKDLRSAAIFARENSNIVKFKINNSQLTISAAASQLGENTTDIEAEVTGDGGEIAFNYKFVSDFLSSLDTERVVLRINTSTTPGIFMAEKDDTLTHLIMPVRLQN